MVQGQSYLNSIKIVYVNVKFARTSHPVVFSRAGNKKLHNPL